MADRLRGDNISKVLVSISPEEKSADNPQPDLVCTVCPRNVPRRNVL